MSFEFGAIETVCHFDAHTHGALVRLLTFRCVAVFTIHSSDSRDFFFSPLMCLIRWPDSN